MELKRIIKVGLVEKDHGAEVVLSITGTADILSEEVVARPQITRSEVILWHNILNDLERLKTVEIFYAQGAVNMEICAR